MLLKAKRLARLLSDQDAQRWLDYELSGYPGGLDLSSFGKCSTHTRRRIAEENEYWSDSLPAIEARVRSAETALAGFKFPSDLSPSLNSPSQWAGLQLQNAVTSVLHSFNLSVSNLREQVAEQTGLLHKLVTSIHSYATEANIALSLGSTAQDIFETARIDVDNFVRMNCPKAAEQLLSAYERIRTGQPEESAQALVTCRRMLLTVADAVFPAQAEAFRDSQGRPHKVGADDYKNRLLAYLDSRAADRAATDLTLADLDHIASRLDVVYEKTCKGIHAEVSPQEARLTLINTYLVLAEVAQVHSRGDKLSAGQSR